MERAPTERPPARSEGQSGNLGRLEAALAREREERAAESDLMAEMLVRVADRERRVQLAEAEARESAGRVSEAEKKVAALEAKAATLDAQRMAANAVASTLEESSAQQAKELARLRLDLQTNDDAEKRLGEGLRAAERRLTELAMEREALQKLIVLAATALEDLVKKDQADAESRHHALVAAHALVRRASGEAGRPPRHPTKS